MVATLSISMMNSGVANAQAAMELSMARIEIDAQSEAIRFIHDSYSAMRSLSDAKQKPYRDLWHAMVDNAVTDPKKLDSLQSSACSASYGSTKNGPVYTNHAFVVNTRKINPSDVSSTIIKSSSGDIFTEAGLYPRIVFGSGASTSGTDLKESTDYTTVASAEGIWVISAQDVTSGTSSKPKFYDFHIYTCWYAPGQTNPTTIGTIIRLYNPEMN